MRRKDGKKKLKALRTMPKFVYGFRNAPSVLHQLNPSLRSSHEAGTFTPCVSMFSGCGGMDLGFLGGFEVFGHPFEILPFRIQAAYDNDLKAVETYRLNLGDHAYCEDLTLLSVDKIPKAPVLLGGFPCQDFSSCGLKAGLDGKRGRLYEIMVTYMKHHQPEIVVGENVLYIEKLHGGRIMQTILKDVEACGYRFKVWRICCQDFGLPQSRTRLFLVGVRRDIKGHPVAPTPPLLSPHRTIDQAIDDLRTVTDESVSNQSQYFVATRATAGAGQGDQKCMAGSISYTIRANAKGRIQFHHALDRRLTVRECARLQSFPDQFVFPHATGPNIMQIGNAVPPMIGHLVGKSIARFLTHLEYTR